MSTLYDLMPSPNLTLSFQFLLRLPSDMYLHFQSIMKNVFLMTNPYLLVELFLRVVYIDSTKVVSMDLSDELCCILLAN